MVTLKNFCRLILTLPLTNITPNRMATTTPESVPMKLSQFARIQRHGGENQNGFNALAQHHEKDEEEKADPAHRRGRTGRPSISISPLSLRPVFIMKTIMVTTKTAATSMTQPSKMSSFSLKRESDNGHADRSGKSRGQSGIDRFAQIVAADLGEIGRA